MKSRFAPFRFPSRGLSVLLRLRHLSAAAFLLAGASCVEPVVVQNYPEYLPESRTAVIHKRGFTIAVSESQRWGDTLQLLPGRYLLEFRERFTGIQGAALCQVEAGGIYEIEIVRKRYMDMAGRYVYEGTCNRLNDPLPPGSTEYPEEEEKSAEPVEPLDTYERPRRRETAPSDNLKPADESSFTDDPVLNPDNSNGIRQKPDSGVDPAPGEEEDGTSNDSTSDGDGTNSSEPDRQNNPESQSGDEASTDIQA